MTKLLSWKERAKLRGMSDEEIRKMECDVQHKGFDGIDDVMWLDELDKKDT